MRLSDSVAEACTPSMLQTTVQPVNPAAEAVNVRRPSQLFAPLMVIDGEIAATVRETLADLAQPSLSVTVAVSVVFELAPVTVKSWNASVVGPKLCPSRVNVNGPSAAGLLVLTRTVAFPPHVTWQLLCPPLVDRSQSTVVL